MRAAASLWQPTRELLVITGADAFWLDPLPYVRHWLARGVIGAPGRTGRHPQRKRKEAA